MQFPVSECSSKATSCMRAVNLLVMSPINNLSIRALLIIEVHSGSALRRALEWRLYEFKKVRGLALSSPPKQPTNYAALLSNFVVNSLVFGAVTLKKSPLPGRQKEKSDDNHCLLETKKNQVVLT